jgi:hypothetical protein
MSASKPTAIALPAGTVFPLSVVGGVDIFGAPDIPMWATGKVVVSVAIVRGQPQAVPQIIQNGTPLDLNIAAGGTMNSGAKYDLETGVQQGDTIDFQMSVSTQLAVLELNFVEDQ